MSADAGYEEYLPTFGIEPEPGYVRHVPNTTNGGEVALAALLRLPRPPTAVLAATDVLAMGLIHAAYEDGIRVPEELSIVGFDDIPLASAMVPGLTTVHMPTAEIVAAGVELAVGDGDGQPPVIFQPTLVVRGSTAAVAPGR